MSHPPSTTAGFFAFERPSADLDSLLWATRWRREQDGCSTPVEDTRDLCRSRPEDAESMVLPPRGARDNALVANDYERLASDLAASIRLGYQVEVDDPNIAFESPQDDEVRWLASWLVSEGWTRSPNWARD